jgi:hypothetical protein
VFAPLQRSGATTITGSFGWCWKQYFGGIKFKRIEPTKKHYTTPPHWPENSKYPNPRPRTTPPLLSGQKNSQNRTHDQALHHRSPLASKLKRIEPTTKHYTTPPHWSELLKEPNPRPSITPPLSTGQKTQTDRTHDQALHHPSHWPENSKEPNPRPSTTPPFPLARKLKRIEPTKKHYTTTAENPFEIYGALNYIDDVTHVHARARQVQPNYNNRLQPFSGLSAITRPFRVFDITFIYYMMYCKTVYRSTRRLKYKVVLAGVLICDGVRNGNKFVGSLATMLLKCPEGQTKPWWAC